jgi:cytochrome c556
MRRATIGAVAAVLALAGCGGSDKPSKDEFAKSAEKVCADLEKQSQELSQSEPDNAQEIVDFTKKARSTAQDAVKKIRALETPEGSDGDKAKEWQAAVTAEAENQLIPALDKLEQAAQSGDEQAIVKAAQDIQGIEATRSDKLAREIGAEGCAD